LLAKEIVVKNKHVAIVGATGAVGREFVGCIESRGVPLASLKLLASAKSAGKKQTFRGQALTVAFLASTRLISFWHAASTLVGSANMSAIGVARLSGTTTISRSKSRLTGPGSMGAGGSAGAASKPPSLEISSRVNSCLGAFESVASAGLEGGRAETVIVRPKASRRWRVEQIIGTDPIETGRNARHREFAVRERWEDRITGF